MISDPVEDPSRIGTIFLYSSQEKHRMRSPELGHSMMTIRSGLQLPKTGVTLSPA
jgi:hypothetical protein